MAHDDHEPDLPRSPRPDNRQQRRGARGRLRRLGQDGLLGFEVAAKRDDHAILGVALPIKVLDLDVRVQRQCNGSSPTTSPTSPPRPRSGTGYGVRPVRRGPSGSVLGGCRA